MCARATNFAMQPNNPIANKNPSRLSCPCSKKRLNMDIHSIRGPLSLKSIWKAPLHQSPSGPLRFLIRSTLSLAGRKIGFLPGVEHINPITILLSWCSITAKNSRRSTSPALLYYLRGGGWSIFSRLEPLQLVLEFGSSTTTDRSLPSRENLPNRNFSACSNPFSPVDKVAYLKREKHSKPENPSEFSLVLPIDTPQNYLKAIRGPPSCL